MPMIIAALWGSTLSTARPPRGDDPAGRATDDPVTTVAGTDDADRPSGSTSTAPGGRSDGDDRVSDEGDPDSTADTDGSDAPDGPVRITAITPWVDSEGEFQLRFETTDAIPPDAQLTYTIHQALGSRSRRPARDAVSTVIIGGQPGRILQVPVTEPLSEFGSPQGGYVLSIPVRSRSSADRTRAFLPMPGVHPVSVVLTAADGPELWSTVVFLNHLPRDYEPGSSRSPSITVSLITPVETKQVFTTAAPTFDVRDHSTLDSLTNLLSGAPEVPLKLLLHADVLAGLDESEDAWAQSVLTTISSALEPESSGGTRPTSGPELVESSFGRSDTDGIVASGGRDVLDDLVSLGREVAGQMPRRSRVRSSWLLDDRLGNRSVEAVESFGFDEVVVAPDRLEPDPRAEFGTPSPGPVRLAGSGSVRAVGYDELLSSILTNPAIDTLNRSHDVITMLMADWFELDSRREPPAAPTSAVIVDPTVHPAAAAALGEALEDGSGPLRSPPRGSVLPTSVDKDGRRGGGPPEASLVDPPANDGTAYAVGRFRETGHQISAYASAAPSEPGLRTWRFRNAQALSLGLARAQVDDIEGAISAEITSLVNSITPPPTRRFVLGSRDTTIPLRFRNGLPYPVELALYARSPRLEIVGGDPTMIRLEPGDNVVDLPVMVRAPGESLLRIHVDTPQGELPVSAFDLPVRSTAISGVGAALSILSITFLVVWWSRTFMRGRRAKARETSAHPSLPTGAD